MEIRPISNGLLTERHTLMILIDLKLNMPLAKKLPLNLCRLPLGNSIWVAGPDQIVGNDDDAKDVNNNGIFDVDPFTGTPIDDLLGQKTRMELHLVKLYGGKTIPHTTIRTITFRNWVWHQMGMNLLHGIAEMIERIIFFQELLEKSRQIQQMH